MKIYWCPEGTARGLVHGQTFSCCLLSTKLVPGRPHLFTAESTVVCQREIQIPAAVNLWEKIRYKMLTAASPSLTTMRFQLGMLALNRFAASVCFSLITLFEFFDGFSLPRTDGRCGVSELSTASAPTRKNWHSSTDYIPGTTSYAAFMPYNKIT